MSKNYCNDHGNIEAGPVADPDLACANDSGNVYTQGCGPANISPCGPNDCSSPQPYYQKVNVCKEDGTQTLAYIVQSQVFKTRYASAMPGCGQQVAIVMEPFANVPFGAWVWAVGVGFLEVVGGNPCNGELTLSNLCLTTCPGQAAPGTPIAPCTLFILTVPLCDQQQAGSSTLFPFLAVDFTAPANGDCIDILLTNVNGLSVNKNISINGGIYRLEAIKSSTLVTICNDGDGLTAGTPVIAQDATGNLIVPIVLVDSNPCSNTSVLAGVPLACVGGVTFPLIGSETGQVLVYDDASGNSQFQNVDIDTLVCTVLTACLTLDPANPPGTDYLVQVVDTSAFIVNQLVTIGDTIFQIVSIIDATSMRLLPLEDPLVVTIYEPGASVCTATCCEAVVANLDASSNFDDAAAFVPEVLTAINTGVVGFEAVLNVNNLSPEYSMGVQGVVTHKWNYLVCGLATENVEVDHLGYFVMDPANPAAIPLLVTELQDSYQFFTVTGSGTPGCNPHSNGASFSSSMSIAAGAVGTIKGRADMTWLVGDLTTGVNVLAMDTRISYLGIALKT